MSSDNLKLLNSLPEEAVLPNIEKKVYRGIRIFPENNVRGERVVTANDHPLFLASFASDPSFKRYQFEWGCLSQGAFNLAYSLLVDMTETEDIDKEIIIGMKNEIISTLNFESWELTTDQILNWIHIFLNTEITP